MDKILIILISLIGGILVNIIAEKIIGENESVHIQNEVIVKEKHEYIRKYKKRIYEKIINQLTIVCTLSIIINLILYNIYGFSLEFLKCYTLITILLLVSIVDIRTHYVYNSTTKCGLILGIIFFIIEWGYMSKLPIDKIKGLLLGFIIMWSLYKITKAFGEGDAEIAMLIGIFIGTNGVISSIIFSIVTCGVISMFLLLSKKFSLKEEIAFVPYLSLGGFLSIILSEEIIFYFNLFN